MIISWLHRNVVSVKLKHVPKILFLGNVCNPQKCRTLTHFTLILLYHTPSKTWDNLRFSGFSWGYRNWPLVWNGLKMAYKNTFKMTYSPEWQSGHLLKPPISWCWVESKYSLFRFPSIMSYDWSSWKSDENYIRNQPNSFRLPKTQSRYKGGHYSRWKLKLGLTTVLFDLLFTANFKMMTLI